MQPFGQVSICCSFSSWANLLHPAVFQQWAHCLHCSFVTTSRHAHRHSKCRLSGPCTAMSQPEANLVHCTLIVRQLGSPPLSRLPLHLGQLGSCSPALHTVVATRSLRCLNTSRKEPSNPSIRHCQQRRASFPPHHAAIASSYAAFLADSPPRIGFQLRPAAVSKCH